MPEIFTQQSTVQNHCANDITLYLNILCAFYIYFQQRVDFANQSVWRFPPSALSPVCLEQNWLCLMALILLRQLILQLSFSYQLTTNENNHVLIM